MHPIGYPLLILAFGGIGYSCYQYLQEIKAIVTYVVTSMPALVFFNGIIAYACIFIAMIPVYPFSKFFPKRIDFFKAVVFAMRDNIKEPRFWDKDNGQRAGILYPTHSQDYEAQSTVSFNSLLWHLLSTIYIFLCAVIIRMIDHPLFSMKSIYFAVCASMILAFNSELMYIWWFDLIYDKDNGNEDNEQRGQPVVQERVRQDGVGEGENNIRNVVVEREVNEGIAGGRDAEVQNAVQNDINILPRNDDAANPENPPNPGANRRRQRRQGRQNQQQQPANQDNPAPAPPPNNPAPNRNRNRRRNLNRRTVVDYPRQMYYQPQNKPTADAAFYIFGLPVLIFVYGGSWICDQIIRYTFNLY